MGGIFSIDGKTAYSMMPKTTFTRFILNTHRWLALLFAPVFLLILLSGTVLALRPMVQHSASIALNAPALITSLDKVDPQGLASNLTVAQDGKSFSLRSRRGGPNGQFELLTGRTIKTDHFDVFDFALRLHKNLLIGAGFLVDIASGVMGLLIISGLLLGWRKLRNTLSGWHSAIAWLAFPLVLLTPATALLMILHLGMPRLPAYSAAAQPLAMARVLEIANTQGGLHGLSQMRVFRRGATMLTFNSHSTIVSGSGQVINLQQGPGWVRMLHEGTWAQGWGGLVNLLSALSLLGLLVSGVWSWLRRRRQSCLRSAPLADTSGSTLVAFASQTGTAAKLAEATANALREAGQPVMLASLAALQPGEMHSFKQTLLIASTTGKGELPDQAGSFMQALTQTGMQGCRFSLLALGDKHYPDFCAGGRQLRAALLSQGAQEMLPLVTVDGNATACWQQWLHKIAAQTGLTSLTTQAPEEDQALRLQLVERTRLDNPNETELKTVWQLRFRPIGPKVHFRPGDLLRISPDKNTAARSYSIGSSSLAGDTTIDLTVTLHCHNSSSGLHSYGVASAYLCTALQLGSQISASLHRHDAFNPPTDSSRPLILVAVGSGIAPFPGFVSERRAQDGAAPVWLFFGNRKKSGDFYYQQLFESCRAEGTIARIDTTFSRDSNDGGYIQQKLEQHGAELLQWVQQRNAIIYVCGNAATLGAGMEAAMIRILQQHAAVDSDSARATLARWKAEGRLKLDLFC